MDTIQPVRKNCKIRHIKLKRLFWKNERMRIVQIKGKPKTANRLLLQYV